MLYHTGSGDTHLFAQVGHHILKLLQAKIMTTDEIREQLLVDTSRFASWEYDIADTSINELLNDLQRLGITEQVDS